MIKLVDELQKLVTDKIVMFKTILSVIKLEAEIARLSIIPLLVTLCLLLVILMSTWISLVALATYGLIFMLNNTWLAISLILIFHLLCAGGLTYYLIFNIRKMTFEKTREYLTKEPAYHVQHQTESTDLSVSEK